MYLVVCSIQGRFVQYVSRSCFSKVGFGIAICKLLFPIGHNMCATAICNMYFGKAKLCYTCCAFYYKCISYLFVHLYCIQYLFAFTILYEIVVYRFIVLFASYLHLIQFFFVWIRAILCRQICLFQFCCVNLLHFCFFNFLLLFFFVILIAINCFSFCLAFCYSLSVFFFLFFSIVSPSTLISFD